MRAAREVTEGVDFVVSGLASHDLEVAAADLEVRSLGNLAELVAIEPEMAASDPVGVDFGSVNDLEAVECWAADLDPD